MLNASPPQNYSQSYLIIFGIHIVILVGEIDSVYHVNIFIVVRIKVGFCDAVKSIV